MIVAKVLDAVSGVKKDGSAYVIPEELEGSAWITIGNEVLQIARIQRLEAKGDLCVITTHRGEQFFFTPEQIAVLKFGSSSVKPSRFAGFTT
jgi:hypothetical protein